MNIDGLMSNLAAMWPRKFDGDAGAPWAKAYQAALGHAQGEKLECAWQRFMEGGVGAHAPTPKELAELLPKVRQLPAAGIPKKLRELREERDLQRAEAVAWLLEWWKPLLDVAERKFPPELFKALKGQAESACQRRALGTAEAFRMGRAVPPCDAQMYADAMWWARHSRGLKTRPIPAADLPQHAKPMWAALVDETEN